MTTLAYALVAIRARDGSTLGLFGVITVLLVVVSFRLRREGQSAMDQKMDHSGSEERTHADEER